jgi:OpgC protein
LMLASLYLAVGLIIALSWHIEPLNGLMPDAISGLIYPIYKSSLAPLRVFHFLALGVLVSRLVPPDWHGLMKPAMRAMIRCGENSLAIYCLGVLLSFVGFAILSQFSTTLLVQAAISIGGIAIMTAAANLMTFASKQDRPGPKLF